MAGSIVPASSVTVRTMADGTLRVSVDIEPRHAQTAFVLFGAPGTPMALAALKVGTQIDPALEPEIEPGPEPKPFQLPNTTPLEDVVAEFERDPEMAWMLADARSAKGGPLAKWAALRCQDERFRAWLRVADELTARGEILAKCGIRSSAELDSNPEAAGLFARHFRKPWHDHCQRNGWVD